MNQLVKRALSVIRAVDMRALACCLIALVAVTSCYSDGNDKGFEPPVDPAANVEEYNEDLRYTQVRFVRAERTGEAEWRFEVTLRHDDTGWDHYADLWEVVDPESGVVLGERVLAHPHVNEQPFTRSQSGIEISETTTQVVVRAKCNEHGYGGRAVLLDLSEDRDAGEVYEVVR